MKLHYSKRIFTVCLLIFLVVFTTSCARKMAFTTSSVVPAAEGSVKIKKDKNKNYAISVTVLHLADPERLQPAKETYVAWIETEKNGIKNIGQLKSSGGLFSSALKGSLNAITSFEPKRVFITAENNGNIQYPGSQVVLTTKNF